MIHLSIPSLPPSSNHAYANIRGTNKRVLTQEGKAYKIATMAHLAQTYSKELRYFKANVPYLMVIRFWFEQIRNKGYPTEAATLYKKIDLSNRVKLLEDAIKDVAAIDDSQNLVLILEKKQGSPERTDIWVWDQEWEASPFDTALCKL